MECTHLAPSRWVWLERHEDCCMRNKEGPCDTIDGVSNSLKRSDRRIVQQDVRDYWQPRYHHNRSPSTYNHTRQTVAFSADTRHSKVRSRTGVGRSHVRTRRTLLAIRRGFRVSKIEGVRMLAYELDRAWAKRGSRGHKCLGSDCEAAGGHARLQFSLRRNRLK